MAKKVISLIMAVILSMSMLMLMGCNGAEKELQKQIDELNALLTEQSSKITELERSKTEQGNKITELEAENQALQEKSEDLEWENKINTADIRPLAEWYRKGFLTEEIMRNTVYYNALAAGEDGKITEKIDGKWVEYEYTPTIPQPNSDEKFINRLEKIAAMWYYNENKSDWEEVGLFVRPEDVLRLLDIKACLGIYGDLYIVLVNSPYFQESWNENTTYDIGDFRFWEIDDYGIVIVNLSF